jgi:hypothetical protein
MHNSKMQSTPKAPSWERCNEWPKQACTRQSWANKPQMHMAATSQRLLLGLKQKLQSSQCNLLKTGCEHTQTTLKHTPTANAMEKTTRQIWSSSSYNNNN